MILEDRYLKNEHATRRGAVKMNFGYYREVRGESKHPGDRGTSMGIYQEAVLSILVY